MLERERHRLILKLVEERAIVSMADLVDLLAASEATVRRDVNSLADQGVLRRVRGGAEAIHPRQQTHLVGSPFAMSEGIQRAQKQAIAAVAAGLVEERESVILAGGTTVAALAERIGARDIDVLTNSTPVAALLTAQGRCRITLPGGRVYREQAIVLSPFDNDGTAHFWARTIFLGCWGINHFGIMETDPLIARAHGRLLARAERAVVLADSRKLRQRSAMIVAALERVSVLITDEGATEAEMAPLREAGVEVLVAAVGEEEVA